MEPRRTANKHRSAVDDVFNLHRQRDRQNHYQDDVEGTIKMPEMLEYFVIIVATIMIICFVALVITITFCWEDFKGDLNDEEQVTRPE